MVEVTRRENHMRMGGKEKEDMGSHLVDLQMVSKTDTHPNYQEKIMTLERRNLNLTMELGGKGQGMQRTSEDDYFWSP